jgi:cobalt-zinc-cadmium efflux system membrane fusion protein
MIRVLKVLFGTVVAVAVILAFAIFVLQIPMPWKAHAQPQPRARRPAPPPVELVEGKRYTVQVPEGVARSLGIRRGDQDAIEEVRIPRQKRPLVMPGSTALDPGRIMRIRARFAPAEVVSIEEVEEKEKPAESMKSERHELRPGDEVAPNMKLGTFFSPDVGNKKNDLFEAIVQLRLDEVILKKAEDSGGAVPDIVLWTARRNVDTDRSAERRARNTLLTWGVSIEDIDAVSNEARQLSIADGRRHELPEAEWTRKHDNWARVVLKAPDFLKGPEPAVVIERNISKGEIVVDNTTSLFTIARVDQLLVVANCPEDELPELYRLRDAARKLRARMKWTVRTVGADPVDGIEGTIAEVGWLIDPGQHTAVIKGYIPNPGGKIRAGQYATATVELLLPDDVVEIPTDALVEDGRQSIVFVQTDAAKRQYTMRRVDVANRYEKTVWVRSKAYEPKTDEERKQAEKQAEEDQKQKLLPKELLHVGEKVLTSGALELKSYVLEKEAGRK